MGRANDSKRKDGDEKQPSGSKICEERSARAKLREVQKEQMRKKKGVESEKIHQEEETTSAQENEKLPETIPVGDDGPEEDKSGQVKKKSLSPQKAPQKSPQKAPQKSPLKSPLKSPQKAPQKSPQKTPQKTPQKAPDANNEESKTKETPRAPPPHKTPSPQKEKSKTGKVAEKEPEVEQGQSVEGDRPEKDILPVERKPSEEEERQTPEEEGNGRRDADKEATTEPRPPVCHDVAGSSGQEIVQAIPSSSNAMLSVAHREMARVIRRFPPYSVGDVEESSLLIEKEIKRQKQLQRERSQLSRKGSLPKASVPMKEGVTGNPSSASKSVVHPPPQRGKIRPLPAVETQENAKKKKKSLSPQQAPDTNEEESKSKETRRPPPSVKTPAPPSQQKGKSKTGNVAEKEPEVEQGQSVEGDQPEKDIVPVERKPSEEEERQTPEEEGNGRRDAMGTQQLVLKRFLQAGGSNIPPPPEEEEFMVEGIKAKTPHLAEKGLKRRRSQLQRKRPHPNPSVSMKKGVAVNPSSASKTVVHPPTQPGKIPPSPAVETQESAKKKKKSLSPQQAPDTNEEESKSKETRRPPPSGKTPAPPSQQKGKSKTKETRQTPPSDTTPAGPSQQKGKSKTKETRQTPPSDTTPAGPSQQKGKSKTKETRQTPPSDTTPARPSKQKENAIMKEKTPGHRPKKTMPIPAVQANDITNKKKSGKTAEPKKAVDVDALQQKIKEQASELERVTTIMDTTIKETDALKYELKTHKEQHARNINQEQIKARAHIGYWKKQAEKWEGKAEVLQSQVDSASLTFRDDLAHASMGEIERVIKFYNMKVAEKLGPDAIKERPSWSTVLLNDEESSSRIKRQPSPAAIPVNNEESSSADDVVEVTEDYETRTGESRAFGDQRGFVWGIMQETKPGGPNKMNTSKNRGFSPKEIHQRAVGVVRSAVDMIPIDTDEDAIVQPPHWSFFGMQLKTEVYVVFPTEQIGRAPEGKTLVPENQVIHGPGGTASGQELVIKIHEDVAISKRQYDKVTQMISSRKKKILDAFYKNKEQFNMPILEEIRRHLVEGLWPVPFAYVIHSQEGLFKRAFHIKRRVAIEKCVKQLVEHVFEHDRSISERDLRKLAAVVSKNILNGFSLKCGTTQMSGMVRALQAVLGNEGHKCAQKDLRKPISTAIKAVEGELMKAQDGLDEDDLDEVDPLAVDPGTRKRKLKLIKPPSQSKKAKRGSGTESDTDMSEEEPTSEDDARVKRWQDEDDEIANDEQEENWGKMEEEDDFSMMGEEHEVEVEEEEGEEDEIEDGNGEDNKEDEGEENVEEGDEEIEMEEVVSDEEDDNKEHEGEEVVQEDDEESEREEVVSDEEDEIEDGNEEDNEEEDEEVKQEEGEESDEEEK